MYALSCYSLKMSSLAENVGEIISVHPHEPKFEFVPRAGDRINTVCDVTNIPGWFEFFESVSIRTFKHPQGYNLDNIICLIVIYALGKSCGLSEQHKCHSDSEFIYSSCL